MKPRHYLSLSMSLLLLSTNLSANPCVKNISPATGSVSDATVVDITGIGFTDVTEIYFGELLAESFVVNSDTSITAIAPEHTPEVITVVVATEEGSSEATEETFYTYQGGLQAILVETNKEEDTITLVLVDTSDPEAELVPVALDSELNLFASEAGIEVVAANDEESPADVAAASLAADPSEVIEAREGNAAVGATSITVAQEDPEAPVVVAITPDQAPLAKFKPHIAQAGQPSFFDATESTTPSGTIILYSWNFGDSQEQETSEPTVSHIYDVPGKYSVQLTVTNSAGTSTVPFVSVYSFENNTLGSYSVTLENNGGATAEQTKEISVGVGSPREFQGQVRGGANVLTWKAPLGGGVVSYRIYRDAHLQNLIAEISASDALIFNDLQRTNKNKKDKNNKNSYYIVAVGEESVSDAVSTSAISRAESTRDNNKRRPRRR